MSIVSKIDDSIFNIRVYVQQMNKFLNKIECYHSFMSQLIFFDYDTRQISNKTLELLNMFPDYNRDNVFVKPKIYYILLETIQNKLLEPLEKRYSHQRSQYSSYNQQYALQQQKSISDKLILEDNVSQLDPTPMILLEVIDGSIRSVIYQTTGYTIIGDEKLPDVLDLRINTSSTVIVCELQQSKAIGQHFTLDICQMYSFEYPKSGVSQDRYHGLLQQLPTVNNAAPQLSGIILRSVFRDQHKMLYGLLANLGFPEHKQFSCISPDNFGKAMSPQIIQIYSNGVDNLEDNMRSINNKKHFIFQQDLIAPVPQSQTQPQRTYIKNTKNYFLKPSKIDKTLAWQLYCISKFVPEFRV